LRRRGNVFFYIHVQRHINLGGNALFQHDVAEEAEQGLAPLLGRTLGNDRVNVPGTQRLAVLGDKVVADEDKGSVPLLTAGGLYNPMGEAVGNEETGEVALVPEKRGDLFYGDYALPCRSLRE
jgi:hypothetical protein